jgi:hypothetical protein
MVFRFVSFAVTSVLLLLGLAFAPAVSYKIDLSDASGSYDVKPIDQSMVCSGPLFLTGGLTGDNLGSFERTGEASLDFTAEGIGSVQVDSVSRDSLELWPLADGRVFYSESIASDTELKNIDTNFDSPQGSTVLTGSTSQLVQVDSMSGLAGASCQEPSTDFWLVGGSTADGRESLLILSNPSPIDETVDINIYTELGKIEVAGTTGVSVLAQSTTVISLASLAPSANSLAVQVLSQGARLAGWIQHRSVSGLESLGVDYVSPAIAAATEVVIPGLSIRGTETINQVSQTEGIADAGHALRVFAPTGATIAVQIISSSEDVFGSVLTETIEAGTVKDFPITELFDGDYTVFITSDQPIYASARVAIGNDNGEPRIDFAWLGAGEVVTSPRAVTVSAELDSLLVLGNPSGETVTASVKNLRTGFTSRVLVPASGTAAIEITGAVAIESEVGVYASVVSQKDFQITSFGVNNQSSVGGSVPVRFR